MRRFKVLHDIPWQEIEACDDCHVYMTQSWMMHLEESVGVSPIVIEIEDESSTVGWFVGALVRKLFIKILGSPFEGWGTSYQGLCTKRAISPEERVEVYRQLAKYCFQSGICHFFQVTDWALSNDTKGLGNFQLAQNRSYYLSLTSTNEALYRSFKQKSAQYAIHKAERLGVTVREATALEAFSEEYYKELKDVFAKQNLKPTYDVRRVMSLMTRLSTSHKVLALEALHPETKACMATILFVYHNSIAFYWGAASWREYQKFCPNELLFFEACKRLKASGVTLLELEGIRKYKEKYNPVEYSKPKLIMARYPILITMKDYAKRGYYWLHDIKSKIAR